MGKMLEFDTGEFYFKSKGQEENITREIKGVQNFLCQESVEAKQRLVKQIVPIALTVMVDPHLVERGCRDILT